ncbi:MAG: hypothetical protein ABI405_01825 [Parafilimonas sp.]
MASKLIMVNGGYDFSNINNLKDLEDEISYSKSSLKKQQQELENRFHKFPHEIVKSAADTFLPSFINKLIANGSWKLLLSSAAMFANPFSKGFSLKKNILGSAKKLGLLTLIKTAYSLWSSKRGAKPPTALKKPAVTTLKTKNIKRS